MKFTSFIPLIQYIDQMRQRTVMEVRESLSQAIAHILKAIPKPQPAPPPPAPQPAVEFPVLRGPLGQILQQFNSYATTDSNILNEIAGADIGKVTVITRYFQSCDNPLNFSVYHSIIR